MPKITVRIPHNDPKAALAKIRPALEKTVADFQGHDLELTGNETRLEFKFKSMAFSITGRGWPRRAMWSLKSICPSPP